MEGSVMKDYASATVAARIRKRIEKVVRTVAQEWM
jgi:hypothetical protein